MHNNITFKELANKYLAWCANHRAPRSLEWYEGHINGFLKFLGDNANMPASDLKPYHIVEWIDSHTNWGDTYRGGAIISIKRIYNWADELGYMETNPIKKLKKPQAKRRDNHMKPEDYDNILSKLERDDPFRDILEFVWASGCRPQEARHIEPRHVFLDRECITFPANESKGKRLPRTIYLHGRALELIRNNMTRYASGKLFRNNRGGAWTKYALCNRMHRLSKVTGKRMAMYDARHGFATRKLIQGHDHLTVAALMGHTDGSMLAKVYSHVDKDTVHLKKALAE
jgi:integrase